MLDTDKQKFLVDHLARSAEDFEASISAVDPADWSTRPDPERWSVGEIAEHVLIIDSRVAGMSATFGEWPEEPYNPEDSARKDQLIMRIAEDRNTRIEAPDVVRPVGRVSTAAHFYPGFRDAHAKLAAAASGNTELLRGRFREHPFLKKLDGYQWLLVCSCHRRRHMSQIEDVIKTLRR